MITIYLAGAIRDSAIQEDVEWRERIITLIEREYPDSVKVLNPLANKIYNQTTKMWTVGGIPTQARGIVAQDLWSVKRADIVIANFSSLSTGYPSIGTVMEVGAAAAFGRKLIYSIIEPGFRGSDNPGVFKLHPFLEQLSTEVFDSVSALEAFLESHLGMLTGTRPRFGGIDEAIRR